MAAKKKQPDPDGELLRQTASDIKAWAMAMERKGGDAARVKAMLERATEIFAYLGEQGR